MIADHRFNKVGGNLEFVTEIFKQLGGDPEFSFLHGVAVGNEVEKAVTRQYIVTKEDSMMSVSHKILLAPNFASLSLAVASYRVGGNISQESANQSRWSNVESFLQDFFFVHQT